MSDFVASNVAGNGGLAEDLPVRLDINFGETPQEEEATKKLAASA